MKNSYSKAYTEVLEVLNQLPAEELNKIPKEKIIFYEKNKDKNYYYTFDISKSIAEQQLSREAGSIIVSIFRDYFCTEIKKEKLRKILLKNEQKRQEQLIEKYNPNNIFNNISNETNQKSEEEKSLVEYKKISWYRKILDKIKSILKI